ncbi:hypothetical protein KSX_70860 [Ktedonospora formicarum]|uniref:Tetratricopeptide repeat protein n=1 Tax=Ktedonospora formicarum TaxID=2778364 RepID=A0A8J3I843_9CHLR|nr:hypothetical protein KSX_70860 [Ktedonospora formicarum]
MLKELGRYEEAVESYNRAIRLNRSHVHPYSSKASALEKLGQWEAALAAYQEALAVCEKALRAEPKSFFLRVSRADILKHVQRYDEAMAEYDLAQNVAPHPFMAVYCIFG